MTSVIAPPADSADHQEPASRGEIRTVFYALMTVLALGSVDQNIVAVALPRIVSELGGFAHLPLVAIAYVLASTIAMPLYGKLSDRYGRKPVLYTAILLFLLGSALSGAARNLPQLIAFRALQGLGGGGLLPLTQIIIGDLVPPAHRGRRQGAVVALFAACSVLGPVLGGLIEDLWSWRWIFYVNLPIGGLALVAIARALRRRDRPHARRIDYWGSVLMTASATTLLAALTLGGSEWSWASPQIGGLCLATILLSLMFARHLRRAADPVLPLELFQDRLFVVACLVLSLTNMALMAAGLFFPLFFQVVLGIAPVHSGLLVIPMMVGLGFASVLNGRFLLRRWGRYKPIQIVGLIIAVLASALIAYGVEMAWGLWIVEPATFFLGAGLGLVIPNMTIAVQNALPERHRGAGTATLTFYRALGGLVGLAASGRVLSLSLHQANAAMPGPNATELIAGLTPITLALFRHAISTVFAAGDVILALALLAILFLPERPLRSSHAAAAATPPAPSTLA